MPNKVHLAIILFVMQYSSFALLASQWTFVCHLWLNTTPILWYGLFFFFFFWFRLLRARTFIWLSHTKQLLRIVLIYTSSIVYRTLTDEVHWITSRQPSPSFAFKRNHSPASLFLQISCSNCSSFFDELSSDCRFVRMPCAAKKKYNLKY